MRRYLTIILATLLTSASACCCAKTPIGTAAPEEEREINDVDTTGTPPDIVEPWTDAGSIEIFL